MAYGSLWQERRTRKCPERLGGRPRQLGSYGKLIPNDPNINGWRDMQRPSTSFACLEVNCSLMVWHGMTKDNSTNAEERPAVDHEVKQFAEVWNALMVWIFTFDVVPASHVCRVPWESEIDQVQFESEAVLEQNPKFRAIHSGSSVQKVIEKVQCTVSRGR